MGDDAIVEAQFEAAFRFTADNQGNWQAVEVRAGEIILVGEYEPRHAAETLPERWKPGTTVKGRVERRNLYLRRPNGTDLKLEIVKRTHEPTP